ncbi:glycosyl hydrolase family 8 [Acuticoccus kandeliae]|uniref:glycosyl hydrolase family 8 n=1 Tax=Acuticoccus kandeliae TaxID=2073160 RepID=UPI0013003249|nr:glycosyl hydrolase family 8 [Acuticoccus kandeliae]
MKSLLVRVIGIIVAAVLAVAPAHSAEVSPTYRPFLGQWSPEVQYWFSSAFAIYKRSFIKADGRVYDPQNGGITHSESQGYGMLLALLADDKETFGKVFGFAKRVLQRSDRMFAWKFVPGRGTPDRNNATDGELLIATALSLASMRWNDARYAAEAAAIADVVGRKLIIEQGDYTLLLPGEWGKPERKGSVATINLSYFIPMTLPVMNALAPKYPWRKVYDDSVRMLDGLIHPPSEWSNVNLYGETVPARGFPPEFSYNAIRIPLYLLQVGEYNATVNRFLYEAWGPRSDKNPFTFDVTTFRSGDRFWDSAYDFLYDLMVCAQRGTPVPLESYSMKMDNYYASSIHLFAIAAMYAHYPNCAAGLGE